MTKSVRFTLIFALFIFSPLGLQELGAVTPPNCIDGTQTSGALYRICMPAQSKWNGDLVLWAHGYVAFNQPLAIPDDSFTLPNGSTISVSQLINGLGYAYSTTSYAVNGLAIPQGVSDLLDVVNLFTQSHGRPLHVFLVGASEGGIVTALSVEKHPEIYTGGLAACGPIGSFPEQINYLGNFRVIFDYFFPDVIPGSPVSIPADVINNWDSVYVPRITAAIQSQPLTTAQLLNVTNASIGLNPSNIVTTVTSVLWYNTFATNDATAKLGGQPFDNSRTVYHGSLNDLLLNALVPRFTANPTALSQMAINYTTSGILIDPLVTLHTTGDQIIPYWHEPEYTAKTVASGSQAFRTNIPVLRYGHCNFRVSEALFAFATLVFKTTGAVLPLSEEVLPDEQSYDEFRALSGASLTLR